MLQLRLLGHNSLRDLVVVVVNVLLFLSPGYKLLHTSCSRIRFAFVRVWRLVRTARFPAIIVHQN
jgi:hypothetical protein